MKTKSRITNSKHAEYAELFEELKSVSLEALAEAPAPTPIIVGSPSTPLGNDVDPNQQTWYHADGVFGFATVVLESGRSGFAQWLLAKNLGNKWWSAGRTKGVGIYAFSRYGSTVALERTSCKVALSIREKLQEPEGWCSSGLRAKEYRLIPVSGARVWCW